MSRLPTDNLRKTLRLTWLFCWCATFTPLSFLAAELSPEERETIYRELQAPIEVKLKNRRTILGHSIEVSGDQLQVGTSEGAGEIIYTFNIDEIDRFNIPGESYKTLVVEWIESGEEQKALQLLELLYQQRVNLIPHLPASESHFFIYYVELILKSDNPARAIAVTKILASQIENPKALQALDDAILESYYNLQLYDDAKPLAEAWVREHSPYERSALGYFVLSANALREEAFENALDLALQPIVFASPVTTEKIADCYAVAISAALGLRDKKYAITLYREMQEREFAWPENDPILAPFHKTILEEVNDA
ncbi:MAG: hypothetical protein ACON4O_05840 [Lentimonas sp.]